MKTETPPPTPTIAELWKEAEYIIECSLPHYEELSNPKNRVNEERRPIYVAGLAKCKDKLESLRQQLLERCKPWISWNADGSHYIEPRVVLYNATPDELRKVAAVYEFAAWELEQHKKEASRA